MLYSKIATYGFTTLKIQQFFLKIQFGLQYKKHVCYASFRFKILASEQCIRQTIVAMLRQKRAIVYRVNTLLFIYYFNKIIKHTHGHTTKTCFQKYLFGILFHNFNLKLLLNNITLGSIAIQRKLNTQDLHKTTTW